MVLDSPVSTRSGTDRELDGRVSKGGTDVRDPRPANREDKWQSEGGWNLIAGKGGEVGSPDEEEVAGVICRGVSSEGSVKSEFGR